MDDQSSLPDSLAPLVQSVLGPVGPEDIELYGRVQAIEERSLQVRSIVDAWAGQQREERQLRRSFARWLVWALAIQILVANVAFFLIGFGKLAIPQWVAAVFFTGVFGEITGLAVMVAKYLFPETGSSITSLMKSLLEE